MSRSLGRNVTLGVAFESSYGVAETSGFKKLPFTRIDFGSAQGLLEDDQLGGGRTPQKHDQEGLDVSGSVVVPVDLRNFGNWLKLVFGAPVSTDETTFQKHIFSGAGDSLPSMTVEVGHPDTPSYFADAGVMANELTLEFTPRGWANATIGLLGKSSVKTSSGKTLAAPATITRLIQHNGFIELDDGQLADIVSATVRYSNNLEGLEGIGDSGEIESIDVGMAGMSGELRVRFSSVSLYDKAVAGTRAKLEFHLSRSGTERLVVVANKAALSRPRMAVQGPGAIEATFNFMAEYPDSGPLCSATLQNDVAGY